MLPVEVAHWHLRIAEKAKGYDLVHSIFGFLERYKGQDLAIQALEMLPKNYFLALLGGIHPESKDNSHFGSLKAMEMAKLKANCLARRIANRIARPFARRKRRLQRLSAVQFSQSTAWYVAVSTMTAIGLNKLEGIPRERIFTIANGIDTSRFHPDAAHRRRQSVRQKLAIGDDEIVLAAIAHNHRLKGIPQLINYLRKAGSIPMTIHALIAGGHSQRPKRLSIGKHTVTYLGLVNDPLDAFAATEVARDTNNCRPR